MLNAWDGSREWNVDLLDEAKGVAAGRGWLAVATNTNCVRFFTTGGCQREVMSYAGPLEWTITKRIVAMKWMDKREVAIMSSIHDATMKEVRSKRGRTKMKPKACLDYNNAMGDVDLSDQYMITYSTARKQMKKYYQKYFHHLLDVAVFNSFVLYKKQGGRSTYLQFILELIQKLIDKYGASTVAPLGKGRRSSSEKPDRLTGRHFPEVNPSSGNKKHASKRCRLLGQ
ncbi:hypothetical protein J437_LFUL018810 [Ladona fulva]|uniref:PiggyBac transposable element-derived protein domain-containing protein n=1 Tax=Ladona fulva TaxID=123851 RepID=A0A8K0PD68_LADFU|nr:hypothetical protein J437_LFUL018810 [Ladona fulva]